MTPILKQFNFNGIKWMKWKKLTLFGSEEFDFNLYKLK